MSIKEGFQRVASVLNRRTLRNTFFGVVMLSETINPYQKLGLGIALLVQPINIPGPVDGLFYLGLVMDGGRGVYKDIISRVTGKARKDRIEALSHCLKEYFERKETHHLSISVACDKCREKKCNSLQHLVT